MYPGGYPIGEYKIIEMFNAKVNKFGDVFIVQVNEVYEDPDDGYKKKYSRELDEESLTFLIPISQKDLISVVRQIHDKGGYWKPDMELDFFDDSLYVEREGMSIIVYVHCSHYGF